MSIASRRCAASYDADQRPTQYVYDQLGDKVQTTTPDGGVTHSTYDLAGHTRTETDPTGAESESTYDYLGRIQTSTIDDRYPSPAALTSTYAYTASVTDPGGAWPSSVTSPAGVVTSSGYDNVGERTSSTDGAGNTTNYEYDLLGRTSGQVNADGTSSTVVFDQGSDPVLLQSLDAGGTVLNSQSATFDGNGNKLTATDARQHTTHFTYDDADRLVSEVQPVTDTSSITTTFGYDAAGNRTRFTDGRHNSWIYTFNTWGMPESTIEPATAAYSSDGDRTSTTAYNELGLPVTQILPGGVSLSSTYDLADNLKTLSGTGADAPTADRNFGYDKDQRLTSATTDPVAATAATSETFGYDDRGDLLSAAGDAGVSSFGYNGDGQMTSRSDAAGKSSYGYDKTGRLTTVDDAATNTRLNLSYNKLDQVAGIAYGDNGDVRSFGYDNLHRLTSDHLATKNGASVASIDYGYDANGNVTSKTTAGFTGSASNTYEYDQADRLTSWTNGSTTTEYGYDDSGNRIRVGSNVYTYDARDQLTSDGVNSYQYTARGTRSRQNDVVASSDAFGQMTGSGGQSYTYDVLGRTITAGSVHLAYSGVGNDVASDGTTTYSRDPNGGLIGIASSSDQRLAFVDQHTDVVGTFGATTATLTGSIAYDPLGNVLSRDNSIGNLGYQSGWTDPASGNVNMAARWYNPANGQFMNQDTSAQSPVPNSAAANPFAFVDDNPMTGTDPSGHGWGWLSDAWNSTVSTVKSVWHATVNGLKSAWHATVSVVKAGWHDVVDVYDDAVNLWHAAQVQIEDQFRREEKKWNDFVARQKQKYAAFNAAIKRKAAAYKKDLQKLTSEVKTLSQAGFKYVKNHAASIATFAVSTLAFTGCEAVLGAVTAGVGAIAGAGICGAVSGAVGGLVDQGFKCAHDQSQCGGSAFLKAGLVGGAVGGLAGLGGAVGGKFLKAVGGKALQKIGGIFSSGAEDAGSSAVASTADEASNSAANSSVSRAADEPSGGTSSENAPSESSSDESSSGCSTQPHSFTAATPVLLADGHTKAIGEIKVGDDVRTSVPGKSGTEVHKVERVIVTTTDHDFVDLKIARKAAPAKRLSRLTKATVALAAGVTVLAGSAATLTTTYHHPFYDRTQAAFVAAKDLNPGDDLQTPTGEATVVAKRLYHATAVTYDLTISGLHTYYVLAGTVPALVHNNNGDAFSQRSCDVPRLSHRARQLNEVLDPIAQKKRDTVVMSTENGPDLVSSGVRDIDPTQRAELSGAEQEARMAGQHAEVTAHVRASDLGLTPRALSSYPHEICAACGQFLEEEGYRIAPDRMSAVMRVFEEG